MITAEIYAHVLPAVRLVMQDKGYTVDTPNAEALAYGALWSYVTHAVEEIFHPPVPEAEAPKRDRRSKAWQCIIRFNDMEQTIAETDAEVIQGTGGLPELVERYATEMYPDDAFFPAPLVASSIKENIPQLRNNLGRYSKAVLRIPYIFNADAFICEVVITKPGA